MALYNQHERIHVDIPGWETYTDSAIVKSVSPDLDGSFISYFRLNSKQVQKAIEQQKMFFSERKKNFEWKVYDTDRPSNIAQQLLNHGFFEDDDESFMVLDLQRFSALPSEQSDCIEVFDEQGIRDAIIVKQSQMKEECEGYYHHLLNLKRTRPDSIKIYVVYDGGRPVSSAWITFNHLLSPFAGIWGGSTIKEYRGRGYYQSLLKQRIRDALLAGKRFLIIDASDMSRPIVEKYGFKVVAKTTPYLFKYGYLL